MRSLCLLILATAPAFAAGPLGFGIKAGVPFNDFTNAVQSGQFNYTSSTQRYIVGPVVELRLPFGLGLELDALYRKFNYNSIGNAVDVILNSRTESNAWEFPLLLKYRFKGAVARPYLEGGVAFDTLQGLKQDITRTVIPTKITTTTSTSSPPELAKSTTSGFVLGAGLDIKLLVLHIAPEIRYTRWGAKHFLDPNGGFGSNQNQAEVLVGFTF